MITEFGANNDYKAITNVLNDANRQAIGWMYWTYSAGHEITSLLLSKPALGDTNAQALVYNPTQALTGGNVNQTKLTILAQPYPQVIAGVPQPWTFDKSTLTFSYSTQKADGSGRFPAGSQTVISAPTVVYPNGYKVTVTGGHVVSAPNANQLLIESNDGADTVSVVVKPA